LSSVVFSAACCSSTQCSSLDCGGSFSCTRCGCCLTKTLPSAAVGGKSFCFVFLRALGFNCECRYYFRIEWVRDWTWWHLYRAYFPLYLERMEELPQNKNYLFCCYPHGVLCSGLFGNFATKSPEFDKLFPGLTPTVHTLDGNFSHPLVRDLILSLGKNIF
jgi:Diacylglycerol acyltransferase